jgi:IPT/TIG domain
MRNQLAIAGKGSDLRANQNNGTRVPVALRSILMFVSLVVASGLMGCSGQSSGRQSPTVTTVAPNSGLAGTVVTITGTNFGATQGTSTVTFNGTAAAPTGWSATSVVAPVPAGAATGNVVVTVGGQASNPVAFTVTTAAPTITTLNPNSGMVATAVTITGTNFGATQGASTVRFNGTAAAATGWSATSVVAPVPAGAATGNVVVTVGGQASNGVKFTVTAALVPTITTVNPSSGIVATAVTITGTNFGATQGTSTVTFNGTAAVPSSWSATSIVAAVPAGATTGNVVVTVGGQASNGVNFAVGSANTQGDVVTWHHDNSRSGLYPNETILTPANVNSTNFGKLGEVAVDGQVDGQILYLNQVVIPGVGTKNVLYVATENDSVYALDADSISGSTVTVLWKTSVLPAGETAAGSGLPCGNINPNGITATPVIDRGRNAMYVVAMSENSSKKFFHRIHALDLTTGTELFGGPTTVAPTFPNQTGTVTFDPSVQHDRAALLESGNIIYSVWSGFFGDCGTYYAWVVGYNADTLAQTLVLNLTPNQRGGGMWMGGGGPAADSSGNIYTITGNGFSTTSGPTSADYPNSFLQLSPSNPLTVADFFAPDNTINEDNGDVDFGSAAPLLLPDLADNCGTTHHLAVGAGKDGNMYVVNRDNMGHYSSANNNIYQQIQVSNNENFSTPIYFNNTVYLCPSSQALKSFPITNALLATTPATQSVHTFGGNGAVASISSSGNTHGIIWALDSGGILFAYDATNLATELYDSNQASGGRDHFANLGGHFITPMVSNGKVYFGTGTTVVVFGVLK